ncbi:MAG: zinc ABC transporter substrate-binding protein [Clostridia bacterium]|nr:zinc ABC transporter substrate-binding protein [Clostridia bacterium]
MKKIISIIAAAALAVGIFSACGTQKNAATEQEKARLKIVTTIFPEYDWVNEILGDNKADVTLLLDNGVDLHSYQPTAEDILKISECDMFIYVGGESDEWAEDALKEAKNKNMKVVNLLEALGETVKEEEVKEGMQEEEHEHEENGEHKEHEEPEYDEHVWLSLKNTQTLVTKIADTLSQTDAKNAASYKSNANAYNQKLARLDDEYRSAVNAASAKTLLFGDRFPFRYLVDDYGLDYYAAFAGCSAETEASFETILFLAKKIDELGLKSITQIESADGRIAETIKQNTASKNQQILTLDSMQSTTSKDISNGASYLTIMKKNLAVLTEALK